MNILPISALTPEDQLLIPQSLINLGLLKRSGFAVLNAWVVMPPWSALEVILEKNLPLDPTHLDSKWSGVSKQLSKIESWSELKSTFKSKVYLVNGHQVSSSDIWSAVLFSWIDQSRSYLHRNSTLPKKTFLTPQLVNEIPVKKYILVTAYYDKSQDEVMIESAEKLSPALLKTIDQLVSKAEKKLVFGHHFTLMVSDQNVWICGLKPFIEKKITPKTETEAVVPAVVAAQTKTPTAVKVLHLVENNFSVSPSSDGMVVALDNFIDFDQGVSVLKESATQKVGRPVICLFPHGSNPELEGSLGLLQNKSLIDKAAKIFLAVRNKHQCHNLELALPVVKSPEILSQIKRELSAREITRKGSLRLWVEWSTAENFLNIEQYLEVGLDGVVINLDRLYEHLTGMNLFEQRYSSKSWTVLTTFLEQPLKKLHQLRVPFLVKGEILHEQEVLDFVVKKGVKAIVVGTHRAETITEHLAWTEKRVITQLLS